MEIVVFKSVLKETGENYRFPALFENVNRLRELYVLIELLSFDHTIGPRERLRFSSRIQLNKSRLKNSRTSLDVYNKTFGLHRLEGSILNTQSWERLTVYCKTCCKPIQRRETWNEPRASLWRFIGRIIFLTCKKKNINRDSDWLELIGV